MKRKKIIAVLLVLLAVFSLSAATWQMGGYLDTQGNPTGIPYAYANIKGRFSSSKTTASPLYLRIKAEVKSSTAPVLQFTFEMHEYTPGGAIKTLSSNENAIFTFYDFSGRGYPFVQKQGNDSSNPWYKLSGDSSQTVASLLSFAPITARVSAGLNRYVFDIPNDGFAECLEALATYSDGLAFDVWKNTSAGYVRSDVSDDGSKMITTCLSDQYGLDFTVYDKYGGFYLKNNTEIDRIKIGGNLVYIRYDVATTDKEVPHADIFRNKDAYSSILTVLASDVRTPITLTFSDGRTTTFTIDSAMTSKYVEQLGETIYAEEE